MKLAPDLRAMLDATESREHTVTGLPFCSEDEILQRRMIFVKHDRRKKLHTRSMRRMNGN